MSADGASNGASAHHPVAQMMQNHGCDWRCTNQLSIFGGIQSRCRSRQQYDFFSSCWTSTFTCDCGKSSSTICSFRSGTHESCIRRFIDFTSATSNDNHTQVSWMPTLRPAAIMSFNNKLQQPQPPRLVQWKHTLVPPLSMPSNIDAF